VKTTGAIAMNASSKYWQMCQISLSQERGGYEYRSVEAARELFEQTVSDSPQAQNGDIQTRLLDLFQPQNSAIDAPCRADAGFSLRCFVSHPILKACQKIDSLFASNNSFTTEIYCHLCWMTMLKRRSF